MLHTCTRFPKRNQRRVQCRRVAPGAGNIVSSSWKFVFRFVIITAFVADNFIVFCISCEQKSWLVVYVFSAEYVKQIRKYDARANFSLHVASSSISSTRPLLQSREFQRRYDWGLAASYVKLLARGKRMNSVYTMYRKKRSKNVLGCKTREKKSRAKFCGR